jgi:hypothetical protein
MVWLVEGDKAKLVVSGAASATPRELQLHLMIVDRLVAAIEITSGHFRKPPQ